MKEKRDVKHGIEEESGGIKDESSHEYGVEEFMRVRGGDGEGRAMRMVGTMFGRIGDRWRKPEESIGQDMARGMYVEVPLD